MKFRPDLEGLESIVMSPSLTHLVFKPSLEVELNCQDLTQRLGPNYVNSR